MSTPNSSVSSSSSSSVSSSSNIGNIAKIQKKEETLSKIYNYEVAHSDESIVGTKPRYDYLENYGELLSTIREQVVQPRPKRKPSSTFRAPAKSLD